MMHFDKKESIPRHVILSAAKDLWRRCANRRGTEILRGAQDDIRPVSLVFVKHFSLHPYNWLFVVTHL